VDGGEGRANVGFSAVAGGGGHGRARTDLLDSAGRVPLSRPWRASDAGNDRTPVLHAFKQSWDLILSQKKVSHLYSFFDKKGR
jgi:hypothetical protein